LTYAKIYVGAADGVGVGVGVIWTLGVLVGVCALAAMPALKINANRTATATRFMSCCMPTVYPDDQHQ
jgi:hypothetical protein